MKIASQARAIYGRSFSIILIWVNISNTGTESELSSKVETRDLAWPGWTSGQQIWGGPPLWNTLFLVSKMTPRRAFSTSHMSPRQKLPPATSGQQIWGVPHSGAPHSWWGHDWTLEVIIIIALGDPPSPTPFRGHCTGGGGQKGCQYELNLLSPGGFDRRG